MLTLGLEVRESLTCTYLDDYIVCRTLANDQSRLSLAYLHAINIHSSPGVSIIVTVRCLLRLGRVLALDVTFLKEKLICQSALAVENIVDGEKKTSSSLKRILKTA